DRRAWAEGHLEHCQRCQAAFDAQFNQDPRPPHGSAAVSPSDEAILRALGDSPPSGSAFDSQAGEIPPALPEIQGDAIRPEPLGRGAFSVVYLARDSAGRQVALKVIQIGGDLAREATRRHPIELNALGRLDHPNVVRILDSGDKDGQYYLAMEYCPGGSL